MKKLGGKRKMRNKKLWKNLMLVTTLTVALGTVSATALAEDDVTLAGGTQVTAFASEGDIDGGIAVEAQAEQTAPEADTTVKDEVSTPEAKAITVDVATSSTTFDGTQDIVITYTINGYIEGTPVYGDMPRFNGSPHNIIREKVSDSVYRFTIEKVALQAVIAENNATDGQTFVFNSGYSYAEDFPTVTLTYTTGDNGDNGNGETPEKPETPDPDNGNGGNGNGDNGDNQKPENPDPENPDNGNGDNGDNNNGGDNNGGDNGNGETPEKPENPDPENPDNGNGDGETPENPDNGNGDNQNPDGDNSETPDDNKDVQDWMTLTPAQKVTTTTQTQTPQTVSTTQTAPKTGDAASTLPLLGTGLTSLGVALGAIFKKRR